MPKILLVEDDNNLREIFQMRLEAEGYQTVTAADGEEGLVVAMKEKPDLVIADVMMPKLSGFEMVENLRSAPEMKDTKVVMMTALGQAEDQARGEKLGVVKYLVKSQVTLEDFAGVVKEILGPGSPTDAPAAPQGDSSSNNKSQESESPMQEDNTQNNPTPAPSDSPAPADPMAGQQSTADEQAAVQGQVDNFAAAPAADAAAPDSDAAAPADAPAPAEPAAPADAPAPAEGDQSGGNPTDATSNAL
ncbi:MAG TPA: response regulator [Candidatus Saccharimonadales bacterium]|nr:response regulator [Candidatus Saccharimonadales bacterium]